MADKRVRFLLDIPAYEYFKHAGVGFGDYQ